MEQQKLYTLQELADALRLNRQTIYNNIKRGRIKAQKYGREYRITQDQFDDLIKNGYNISK